MKKLSILSVIMLTAFFSANAQGSADSLKAWKYGVLAAVNFTQVSLTNWAAGGENSLSLTGILNGAADYTKDKSSWSNSLEMAYGFLKSGDQESRKNEDKWDLNSKYGYKASKFWDYSLLARIKSQFTKGYNYPNDSVAISDVLSPGYISLAAGMDYKPGKYASLFISPATGRYTIVRDQDMADAGLYGVDPAEFDGTGKIIKGGENVRAEFGASMRFNYKRELMENVLFQTRLDLFNNFTNKVSGNRGNIDVEWESLLSLRVNKYISTNISAHLIYDHDVDIPVYETVSGLKTITGVGPRTQFKEVFGIGIAYKY